MLALLSFSKKGDHPNKFVVGGFRNWKKVNCGENCAFLCHIGKHPNSSHKVAIRLCDDMMNQFHHIENLIEKHTIEPIIAIG